MQNKLYSRLGTFRIPYSVFENERSVDEWSENVEEMQLMMSSVIVLDTQRDNVNQCVWYLAFHPTFKYQDTDYDIQSGFHNTFFPEYDAIFRRDSYTNLKMYWKPRDSTSTGVPVEFMKDGEDPLIERVQKKVAALRS